jgi:hypothetical protein
LIHFSLQPKIVIKLRQNDNSRLTSYQMDIDQFVVIDLANEYIKYMRGEELQGKPVMVYNKEGKLNIIQYDFNNMVERFELFINQ